MNYSVLAELLGFVHIQLDVSEMVYVFVGNMLMLVWQYDSCI